VDVANSTITQRQKKRPYLMDWITSFLDYTEGMPTPPIYRLWAGITALSGALERRVYVETAKGVVYPNLFTFLVGPPGIGKSQAIGPVTALWKRARKLHVAPDSMTKSSLVDALARSTRKIISPQSLEEYSTLLIPCSEFGVLMPKYDPDLVSSLNNLYDNPLNYREERRYLTALDKNPDIPFPQLVILAGTQPAFLSSMLPEEVWGMGFPARIIMVYSGVTPKVELFPEDATAKNQEGHFNALASAIIARSEDKVRGRFDWEPAAKVALRDWHLAGMPPIPQHSRLQYYNQRRILHTLKLCMIASFSRAIDLTVRLEDFNQARTWLLEAETTMPNAFRDMVAKSDSQVVQELHWHLWKNWGATAEERRKPFTEAQLYEFLRHRVPSDKITRILDVADKAGVIVRIAGTNNWIPKRKDEHGIE